MFSILGNVSDHCRPTCSIEKNDSCNRNNSPLETTTVTEKKRASSRHRDKIATSMRNEREKSISPSREKVQFHSKRKRFQSRVRISRSRTPSPRKEDKEFRNAKSKSPQSTSSKTFRNRNSPSAEIFYKRSSSPSPPDRRKTSPRDLRRTLDLRDRDLRRARKTRSRSPMLRNSYSRKNSQPSYSRPRSRSPYIKTSNSRRRNSTPPTREYESMPHGRNYVSMSRTKEHKPRSRSTSPRSPQYIQERNSRSPTRQYVSRGHERKYGVRSHSRSRSPTNRCKSRSRTPSFPHSVKRGKASHSEIERFIDEERLLMEKMDIDKSMHMSAPEKHPDYDREWERFYTLKSNQYGALHPSYLQEEWAQVWKMYFFNAHETSVRQERNLLMNKHKVFYSDLERYQEEKRLKTQTSVTVLNNEVEQKAPNEKSRLVALTDTAIPSTSKGHPVIDLSPSPPPFNIDQLINAPNPAPVIMKNNAISNVGKGVPVLQTLQLLSAIEDDLEKMGSTINQCLMRANVIEQNSGFKGNSVSLLEDLNFCLLLRSCKTILHKKLSNLSSSLSENKVRAYITCNEHINKLLENSKVRDLLSKHDDKLREQSYQKMIKSSIEKKVIEEFNKAGRVLRHGEKVHLVEAEYQRILPQLSQELGIITLNQENSHPKNKQPSTSLHQSLGLSENCLNIHQYGSQDQQGQHPQKNISSRNTSLVTNINWEELQKVVETVSKTTLTVGSTQGNTHGTAHGSKSARSKVSKTIDEIEIIDDDIIVVEEVKQQEDIICLDDLTHNELVDLCTNIKQLDKKTQSNLIEYMKKLEKTNPPKVQELKRYLNI